MDIDKVKLILEKALESFYKFDNELLNNCAHEQAVSHRIAFYIEKELPEDFGYAVDCEYNREVDNVKMLNAKKVRPDIIVHKRGSNVDNLLVVEIKKNYESSVDKKKLKDFTNHQKAFSYKLGVFLNIKSERKKTSPIYFENGKEVISV